MKPDSGASSRLERPALAALPFAVVCAALLFLLWPVLIGDQTLFFRDLAQQYIGTARLLHSGDGSLLWDPFLNGGQPLLGNPNRFILYPSRVLYLVLAPAAGLNWEITLHLLLGGIGTVLLARRLGGGGAGSAVAGLAFSLSGLSVSITNHLGRLLAYHWMPWILLAVHAGLCERGVSSRRWRLAIPVFFAIQWLTGTAEIVAMTAFVALCWMLVCGGAAARKRRILPLGIGLVILGVGLAAIQIIPAAEMVFLSDRSSYSESGVSLEWSAHPLRLAEMVIPGFCGPVDVGNADRNYWGAGLTDHGFPLILSLYLGASVVFLAVLGWLRSRGDPRWRSLRIFFAALIGGAIVLACGEFIPVVGKLFVGIPGISVLRYPVKALLLGGLPVALLAGRGCDAWLEDENGAARRAGGFSLAAAGFFLALLVFVGLRLALPVLELMFPGRGEMAAGGLPWRLVHVIGVFAVLSLVGLAAGFATKKVRSALVVVVVAADLLSAAVPVLPLAPARLLNDEPQLVDTLRATMTGGRLFRDLDPETVDGLFAQDPAWVLAERYVWELKESIAETFLIPIIYHLDIAALGNRRIARLKRAAAEVGWDGRVNLFHVAAVEMFLTTDVLESSQLDVVGTEDGISGLPLFLYRISPAPGMAHWVAGARMVSSPQNALGMLVSREFDPGLEIVREIESPTTRSRSLVPMSLQPGSEIWRQEISAPGVGFIVLAVPWHPDLVIEVNGRVVSAERVNYAFTGFAVERGRYDVRVLFAPRAVFWGGVISVLSLVTWFALAVASWRSRRRPEDQGSCESSSANSPRSA